ncbi:ABC transporter substrate-binding protein [Nocardioides sp. Soil796]|uniref:ABC transporter substrate-binding protein n=1 Tax=Nocardioides sp. Soil796 TaxID=1736412 RepID=UPI000709D91B|nr:ABC transporter substrate-binding protein [Nocardioides sp. Soil796]KRF10393.1 hypothetical protein ASH02_19975 [Nocardioides sp. Soil796]
MGAGLRKRVVALAAAVLLVPALASCSGDDDSVKIGYIAGATVPIMDVVAEEKGFFEARDVDVEKVTAANGPSLVNLAVAGGLDVTWAPTSNVLAASSQVEVVSGALRSYAFEMIQRNGYDDAAFDKAYPENLKELSGARIGVSATGSYGQVIAEQMLREAGVDPGDVTFVGVGVEGTSLGALKSKQIDLLMAGPVTTAKAEVDDIATSLVGTRDIPRLAQLPEDMYVVKKGADDKTRDKASRYLAAIQDAITWSNDPANAKELGEILAKHFELEGDLAALVAEQWAPTGGDLINEFRLSIDPKGYEAINKMLVDNGLLKAPVAYDDLVRQIEPKV